MKKENYTAPSAVTVALSMKNELLATSSVTEFVYSDGTINRWSDGEDEWFN